MNLGWQRQKNNNKKCIFAETVERTEVVAGVLHAWSASSGTVPLPRPPQILGLLILSASRLCDLFACLAQPILSLRRVRNCIKIGYPVGDNHPINRNIHMYISFMDTPSETNRNHY